jgi:glutathione peroxidase
MPGHRKENLYSTRAKSLRHAYAYLGWFVSLSIVTAITLLAFKISTAHAETVSRTICDASSSYQKRQLDSDQVDNLCERFSGQVMLVVNTASRCAFTDQYEGLEALHAKYRDQWLAVIGFPSNDFGNQEPGSEGKIKQFCRLTYGVQFPMYEKTRVTGDNADPFYQALTQAAGKAPGWNFHKYLINRQGELVGSYSSFVDPQSSTLTDAIESLL